MKLQSRYQLRGNCQCCGREQAVLKSGWIAKHGYKVEHGFFNGVCVGHQEKPLQVERKVADAIVAKLRKQAAQMRAEADDFEAGIKEPRLLPKSSRKRNEEPYILWAEADIHQRKAGLELLVYRQRLGADAGDKLADELAARADAIHGQPMKEKRI